MMSGRLFSLVVFIFCILLDESLLASTDANNKTTVHYEFIHIAKNAGRAIKHMHNEHLDKSPFSVVHGHRVRVRDVQKKENSVAVAVIRDPVERFQSAFAFVRTGGFGMYTSPNHPIINFNTTDELVEGLMKNDSKAMNSLRCDAKLRNCAREIVGNLDLDVNTAIEFRPQSWWFNGDFDPQYICYNHLATALPLLDKKRVYKEGFSLKGHWFVKPNILKESHKQFLCNLYRKDYEIYHAACIN